METASPDVRASSVGTGRNYRPPVLDLGLLLSSMGRSLPVALVIGIAVGLLAGVVASTFRDEYTATTTVNVATPGRAERDAATMEALAAGMSEYVTDERARFFIEEGVGEAVTLYGLRPSVAATTSKIPGLLEISTRSHSGPLAAAKMGNLAVEAMNLRADEAREEVLEPVAEAAQQEIDRLNEQIEARRRIDRTADTSDLLALIYEARAGAEQLRTAYPTATIVAQTGSTGPSWPAPVSTGFVVGITATVIAVLVLGLLRLRRGRRTDAIWARAAGHRHLAAVDVDSATSDELPPLTEAAVSAVLSAGGTVVVLGRTEPIEVPSGDGIDAGRLMIAPYDDPWWREVPAADVDLGVVVVDDRSTDGRTAEAGLATFSEVGVPARVAVRTPGKS